MARSAVIRAWGFYLFFFPLMFLVAIFSTYSVCRHLLEGYLTRNDVMWILLYAYQEFFARESAIIVRLYRWFSIPSYFKEFTFLSEEQVKPQRSLICAHPHNIFTLGLVLHLHGNIRNCTHLATRLILRIPIFGLLLKQIGMESVAKANMLRLMRRGRNITLVPGGFEEQTITDPRQE